MNAEKEFVHELVGMIIIGGALITVIVGLFILFSIEVRVPQIPNF